MFYLVFIIIYYSCNQVFLRMQYFKENPPSDTAFLDRIIFEFNSSNNVPFLDRVINAMERSPSAASEQPQKKTSPGRKSVLNPHQRQIIDTLIDFFKEQKTKSPDNRHLRKVFSILSKKVNHVNYVTFSNNPFWRLENNLRTPILQLLRENDYYLARSLENDHVYLVPTVFKFTLKFPNTFKKMEYK